MNIFEKLSNQFTKLAAKIETNPDSSKGLNRLVEPLYMIAGVVNGTRDYTEARIHHSLKDEWYKNIAKQSENIQKFGSSNNGMNDDVESLQDALSGVMKAFGIDESALPSNPHKISVGSYLAFELDKLIEDHDMNRIDAMKHLMSMDLTEKQHRLKIV